MKKNYYYKLTATPAKSTIKIDDYTDVFPKLIKTYNSHTVKFNPKEIGSITLSETVDNAIDITFGSEKPLPKGRELQSLRRLSEGLALYDSTVVTQKSHVLISA